jgi:hypothetical protein
MLKLENLLICNPTKLETLELLASIISIFFEIYGIQHRSKIKTFSKTDSWMDEKQVRCPFYVL